MEKVIKMFKWMLDAGHSYSTPGKRTIDGSMKEYEFNKAVAEYCKELASAYEGIEVIFAHSDSRDVPLKERTDHANRIGADCFTSIHANAAGSGWNNANGIETFVYKTRPAKAYALALQVQRNLVKETGLLDRGVKTADFAVLRESRMDSILCECGFMTNQKEAALLKSDDYRRKVAKAIVEGHASFYGWQKKPKKSIHVYTGGYGGEALATVQGFIASNKWWYQPTRNQDGTLSFLVGGFAEGSEAAVSLETFLKEHNWWYEIR
jgi:N-acetylmuramoyl-L-alanine amidase